MRTWKDSKTEPELYARFKKKEHVNFKKCFVTTCFC